jgi:hypothetical protein
MLRKATPKPQRAVRRRWNARRIGLIVLGSFPVLLLGLWIAVNRIEWLGPFVADGLRAIIGKDAVAELENVAYGIQDRVFKYTRSGEAPKAYWEVPTAAPTVEEARPAATDTPVEDTVRRPEPPKEVGPVHEAWSAPGDGKWLPVLTPDVADAPTCMWKTLLHPDKNRSWAEVFVVAIEVASVDLQLVAGSKEPVATVKEAETMERPARVPESLENEVLAAFNGGFKTEHGGYGMRVGTMTLVAPLPLTCAVASFEDYHVEVAPWEKLKERENQMRWWRQTPGCMVEEGKLNERLLSGNTKKWGATLDGETVIRRSAMGVDGNGRYVFFGISNHTTANAIADGMKHAGAVTVAQMDVNFSYPKFVLFERQEPGGKRMAVALASGFEFSEDEYIRKRNPRDFFYVTARRQREASAR